MALFSHLLALEIHNFGLIKDGFNLGVWGSMQTPGAGRLKVLHQRKWSKTFLWNLDVFWWSLSWSYKITLFKKVAKITFFSRGIYCALAKITCEPERKVEGRGYILSDFCRPGQLDSEMFLRFFSLQFFATCIFGCSKWMGPRHTKLLNMTTIFCGSNADPPWGLEGLLLRGLWFWQWCIRWRSDLWMIGFGTKKFRSQRKRIFGSSVIKERFWELDDDIHCCFLKNVTDCWLQVG